MCHPSIGISHKERRCESGPQACSARRLPEAPTPARPAAVATDGSVPESFPRRWGDEVAENLQWDAYDDVVDYRQTKNGDWVFDAPSWKKLEAYVNDWKDKNREAIEREMKKWRELSSEQKRRRLAGEVGEKDEGRNQGG